MLRIVFFAGVSILAWVGLAAISPASVSASSAILRPNGSPASSVWTPYGGATRHGILANVSPVDSQWICRPVSGNSTELYDLTTVNVGQGAYAVSVTIHHAGDYKLFSSNVPYTVMGIHIDGVQYGNLVKQAPPGSTYLSTAGCGVSDSSRWTSWTTFSPTAWTKSTPWTQSQIDNMKLILGAETKGDDRSMGVRQYYATVVYDIWPSIRHYYAATFQDSSTTAPGARITSGTSTSSAPVATQLTTSDQKFRQRMAVARNMLSDDWHTGSVRLMYAKKTASTCHNQTGWEAVTSSSQGIRFYDNPSVANGAAINHVSGAPVVETSSIVTQSYREANDAPITNRLGGSLGAVWEFSLQLHQPNGATFCLRLDPVSPVLSMSGAGFDSSVEIRTPSAPLEAQYVDARGVPIGLMSSGFPSYTADGACKEQSALLSSGAARLRVTNGTVSNGWSSSIAMTNGVGALWTSVEGKTYDYNDPSGSPSGCADGPDPDAVGGQLTVVPPSTGQLQSFGYGCTNTGVTIGSEAAFSHGVVDSITLLSANATAGINCSWDLMWIVAQQKIPGNASAGAYSLDFTITTVAS